MNEKTKILFVSDVPDFKGGAERSLFDLMANPHIEPVLSVPAKGPLSEVAQAKGMPYHVINYGSVLSVRRPFKFLDIPRTFFSALKAAVQLKKLSKEIGVKALHTNGLKAHGVSCLARLLGGAPVVIHFRAIPFTALEKGFWKAVQLIASQVILVSRPCWPGEKLPPNVQVVFNAIDLPEEGAVKAPQSLAPFVLGFAGRIQFTKGVDTLIEWFSFAVSKGLDLKLSIRGEAAPDEPDYEARCRALVKDYDLEDRISFEGRREGFDQIYGGVHANVVSSVVPDPLPRSVMEASALGIPVLGYPAGGIPYMFEDGVSGFLVSNEQEFYERVKALIEDGSLRSAVSQSAIENAKANFSMMRLHEQVVDIYHRL